MDTLIEQAKKTPKSLLTQAKAIHFAFAFPNFVEIDNGASVIEVHLFGSKAPHVSLSVYPSKFEKYTMHVNKVNAGDVAAMAKWPANAEKHLSTEYTPKANLMKRLNGIAKLKILHEKTRNTPIAEKVYAFACFASHIRYLSDIRC